MGPIVPAAVAHGGAGSNQDVRDGCERAVEAALAVLTSRARVKSRQFSAPTDLVIDAAVAATVVLEDDGRFNAGSGSNLRLDGRTIEMDAAVADSASRFGAVAAIENVQNPVQVARQVLGTPHVLLVGAGAVAFARRQGFQEAHSVSGRARRRYGELKERLLAHGFTATDHPWDIVDLQAIWNFDAPLAELLGGIAEPSDTVGACARDAEGNFAASSSTGGTALMLRGRVGDTPLYGAGLFAGPAGAVTATGKGEEIIRLLASKQVYDWIAAGLPAQVACERGVALLPKHISMGFIAVDAQSTGAASNRDMAWASGGPDPN